MSMCVCVGAVVSWLVGSVMMLGAHKYAQNVRCCAGCTLQGFEWFSVWPGRVNRMIWFLYSIDVNVCIICHDGCVVVSYILLILILILI